MLMERMDEPAVEESSRKSKGKLRNKGEWREREREQGKRRERYRRRLEERGRWSKRESIPIKWNRDGVRAIGCSVWSVFC